MALHQCPECLELIGNSIGSPTQCTCGHCFEATEETECPFGVGAKEKPKQSPFRETDDKI